MIKEYANTLKESEKAHNYILGRVHEEQTNVQKMQSHNSYAYIISLHLYFMESGFLKVMNNFDFFQTIIQKNLLLNYNSQINKLWLFCLKLILK